MVIKKCSRSLRRSCEWALRVILGLVLEELSEDNGQDDGKCHKKQAFKSCKQIRCLFILLTHYLLYGPTYYLIKETA